MNFIKYPRTEHVLLSKETDINSSFLVEKNLLPNFTSLPSFSSIIIEEKMDGIGLGIGFQNGHPFIQYRGHIFNLNEIPSLLNEFCNWLLEREELLYELLGEEHVLFGEWLYYKHTLYYDNLSDYFLEYDIYNKTNNYFLSTYERQQFIGNNSSWLQSVRVISSLNQHLFSSKDLNYIINHHPTSLFKTLHNSSHFDLLLQHNNYASQIKENTLLDLSYEGFYIKLESLHQVEDRYKWIRKSFMDHILNGEHWKKSPLVINNLTISNNLTHSLFKI